MRNRPETDEQPLSNVAVDVLLSLTTGEKHGYAIKREVEQRVGGGFILGSGSLYQAIQRLERRGLIAEVASSDESDTRRGRVYRITREGRASLGVEFGRMDRILRFARANALLDRGA